MPGEGAGARENVVVCVRLRPSERDDGVWTFEHESNRVLPTEQHPALAKRAGSSTQADDDELRATYDFRYDHLVLGNERTESLYEASVYPVVRAAMEGYNGTVFAYGQTGSGKTYTMSGTHDEPGVIPCAVHDVFSMIREAPHREFLLRVSYLEIYNETLQDLLAPPDATPKKGKTPRIVEERGRVVLSGLHEEVVTTPHEVLALLDRGQAARHVGATDWNTRSSRSHSVFQITIESREEGGGGAVRVSQLNLIDLAGSERAASEAARRKEGAYINKSLLTLGTVIAKLTEPHPQDTHIPYRDSKLTRLLQTSLSGDARVAVICTISDASAAAIETLSTLKFGRRCKMVVTKAQKHVTVDDKALLEQYRKELDTLRARLEASTVESPPTTPTKDIEALRSERAAAEEEVAQMQETRTDLKQQIDHLTRLILTSRSVAAQTPARVPVAEYASSPRRGPRMSDLPARTPVATPRADFAQHAELATVRRELLQAKEAHYDAISTLEDELAAAKRDTEAANAAADEYKFELQDMQHAYGQARDLAAENEGLYRDAQAELDAARDEADELRAELDAAKADADELRADNDLAKDEADELRAELDDLQAKIHEVVEERDAAFADVEDARRAARDADAHLDALREQVEVLQREADDARADADDARNDAEDARAAAAEAKRRTTEALASVSGTEKQLRQAREEHATDEAHREFRELVGSHAEASEKDTAHLHARIAALERALSEERATRDLNSLPERPPASPMRARRGMTPPRVPLRTRSTGGTPEPGDLRAQVEQQKALIATLNQSVEGWQARVQMQAKKIAQLAAMVEDAPEPTSVAARYEQAIATPDRAARYEQAAATPERAAKEAEAKERRERIEEKRQRREAAEKRDAENEERRIQDERRRREEERERRRREREEEREREAQRKEERERETRRKERAAAERQEREAKREAERQERDAKMREQEAKLREQEAKLREQQARHEHERQSAVRPALLTPTPHRPRSGSPRALPTPGSPSRALPSPQSPSRALPTPGSPTRRPLPSPTGPPLAHAAAPPPARVVPSGSVAALRASLTMHDGLRPQRASSLAPLPESPTSRPLPQPMERRRPPTSPDEAVARRSAGPPPSHTIRARLSAYTDGAMPRKAPSTLALHERERSSSILRELNDLRAMPRVESSRTVYASPRLPSEKTQARLSAAAYRPDASQYYIS